MADDKFGNVHPFTSGPGSRDANMAHGPTSSASAGPPPLSSPTQPPPGHNLRRAATMAEPSQLHRRSTMAGALSGDAGSSRDRDGRHDSRRRSSITSDLSFDTLGAHPDDVIQQRVKPQPPSGNWQSIPLAFALLPALGGLMIENGSAFVTDFLLLGLAAVFLHWSISQPWQWYESTQQIRVLEEAIAEMDVDDEAEDEDDEAATDEDLDHGQSSKGRVRGPLEKGHSRPATQKQLSPRQKALRELYFQEVMAVLACFMLPVVGASILHAIRTQLSRPSEGLVSNYNLTVFLLAAEVKPVRLLIRLLEARTMHLQRIVHTNPFGPPAEPKASASQLAELLQRVEQLEGRLISTEDITTVAATAVGANPQSGNGVGSGMGPAAAGTAVTDAEAAHARRKEAILREARLQMQPEVDALNRAVRRYEKKQTILAVQLDNRLQLLDGRLDDAMSLATHAFKMRRSQPSFWVWFLDQVVAASLMPVRGMWLVITLPYRALSVVLGRGKGTSGLASRGYRSGRSSRSSSMGGGDRFPTRVSRR